MKSFHYTIRDTYGIHARPACQLAKLAGSFDDTTVTILRGPEQAEASQLMDVMGLCIKKDDEVIIEISGQQEETCFHEIRDFFEKNL